MDFDRDDTARFVEQLAQTGVVLEVVGEKLRYRAATSAVTPECLAGIRDRKASIIAYLSSTDTVAPAAAGNRDRTSFKIGSRPSRLPLSYGQERLWFLDQLGIGRAAYNIVACYQLAGILNVAALRQALEIVITRHEALRTQFDIVDGEGVQVVRPPGDFALRIEDISTLPLEVREIRLAAMRGEYAAHEFDLTAEPPLRIVVVKLSTRLHALAITTHHIVTDRWSFDIFLNEVSRYYSIIVQDEPMPDIAVPLQFSDFTLWERGWLTGAALDRRLGYWIDRLRDVPDQRTLLADRRGRTAQSSAKYHTHQLGQDLSDAIRALARAEGTTPFSVTLATYQLLLGRLVGQDDIIVGSAVSGRTAPETNEIIGFFANTVPLRASLGKHASFRSLLKSVSIAMIEAQENQDFPYTKLIDALNPERQIGQQPLINSAFVFQTSTGDPFTLHDLRVEPLEIEITEAAFDLSMRVEDTGTISCTLVYAADKFDLTTIERIAKSYEVLLCDIVRNPARAPMALNILTAAQRHELIAEWPRGQRTDPAFLPVHALITLHAERTPSAVAVVMNDDAISYRELDRRSNRLAHHFIELGIDTELVVGICMDRSIETIIVMLAIWKAGGAYLPLDPSLPPQRLEFMARDAGTQLIVHHARFLGRLPDDLPRFAIETEDAAARALQDTPPAIATDRDQLAALLYTSGSTGAPKGSLILHGGLANLAVASTFGFGADASDRVLQFARLSFDAATCETILALTSGAALHIVDQTHYDDAALLQRLLREQSITMAILPPSLLPLLDPYDLPHLALVMSAGEELPASVAREWAAGRRIVNGYGPTECSICATVGEVDVSGDQPPAIGRPIANVRTYVLDAALNPVPVGVPGELCIAGPSVGRGYLNHAALTATTFIPDPFARDGARLYRTGDLVRWRTDGQLEFVSRLDNQVKIRGFRIELGEIEAVAMRQADVVQAVATAVSDGTKPRSLTLYVVPAPAAQAELVKQTLAEALREALPAYMIPHHLLLLDRLPLNANGKIDRAALPTADRAERSAYIAPITPTEEQLATIWQDLLGTELLGRHANFFDLGGHSLLAMRLVARVRDWLAIDLELRDVFEAPTLDAMATILDLRGSVVAALPMIAPQPRPVEGVALSFAQERLWLLEQMGMAGSAYHIPIALRLRGSLDASALETALRTLVDRHESLRTRFAMIDGEARQFIMPGTGFSLDMVHFSDITMSDDEVATAFITAELQRAFDLTAGPLFRASLLVLGTNDHMLVMTMHHIVSDGWSMAILSNELSALYRSMLAGEPNPLPPLAVQYADFAIWQRTWHSPEKLAVQARYWRTTLGGAPSLLDLPTDRPRPPQQNFAGGLVDLTIDTALTARLKLLSQRQQTTLFVTLLSGWAIVMSALSGQRDIVIGAPSANRTRSELEGLIGFFINTLALRIDLTGNPTIAELLDRVKIAALDGQANQDLPTEQIIELVRPSHTLAHSPIYQVLFSWQSNDSAKFDFPDLKVNEVSGNHTISKFDLTLNMLDNGDHLIGAIEYATSLFERQTIERWTGYLHTALTAMVDDPTARLGAVDLLSPGERDQVLTAWNATDINPVSSDTLHGRFERHAHITPKAIAVTDGFSSLDYASLNARANQLARLLRMSGVCPDMPVAICTRPSIDMVVGLLAILKAGGAYLPLDPDYPLERLSKMLTDAGCLILLTQSQLADRLPIHHGFSFHIDDPGLVAHQPYDDIPASEIGVTGDHLAYVIYTSGSTGQPKGVMVEHRNVANYLDWVVATYQPDQGETIPMSTPLAFDATVTSLWGALCTGRRLELMPDEDERLTALAAQLRADPPRALVKLTPAHLQLLGGSQSEAIGNITARALIVGGEAFPAALAQFWQRRAPNTRLINEYGPTETTVGCTVYEIASGEVYPGSVPIGRPIANTRIYILNEQGTSVPIGAVGEIHIGGAGVARGYINNPRLTAERFVPNPFVPHERLYRSGDLARYRENGAIDFLGRNDFQVKLRGFRIEVAEIETVLVGHPAVKDAVVILSGKDPEGQRLVAFWTPTNHSAAQTSSPTAKDLRAHLAKALPSYMMPGAFFQVESFSLTPNGKVDRDALRGQDTFNTTALVRDYVPPSGAVERLIAGIWEDVLNVPLVSRHDGFFDLGGHSLLAVRILERMQKVGLASDVQKLFTATNLAAFAAVSSGSALVAIASPPNRLTVGLTEITPAHLPLIDLDQAEINAICATVPGGAGNVQDVYPLAPLQGGILFHSLLARSGDPYIVWHHLAFQDRAALDRFFAALSATIARHDILRTAIVWQGVREPVQVVWRNAFLELEEPILAAGNGDTLMRLHAYFDPRSQRMDVARAPMIRLGATYSPERGEWVAVMLIHHLIDDNITLNLLLEEVAAHMADIQSTLAEPLPFRDFIARIGREEREAKADHDRRETFDAMLGDVTTTTSAFGLVDIAGDGGDVTEIESLIDGELDRRLRQWAVKLRVSTATLFHVVWAYVLAGASGRPDPVFGTLVSGRLNGTVGVERTMGLFVNTLPIRIDVAGVSASEVVRRAHTLLARILRHESVPLRRTLLSSNVAHPAPLFTALLNFRQSGGSPVANASVWEGVRHLAGLEVSNYPLYLMVDDLGDQFRLRVQAIAPIDAQALSISITSAAEAIATALDHQAPTLTVATSVACADPVAPKMVSTPPHMEGGAEASRLLGLLWADLLGGEEGRPGDDFLARGGTSLLLIRLADRLRDHGFSITLADLFAATDFTTMAVMMNAAAPGIIEYAISHRGIPQHCVLQG